MSEKDNGFISVEFTDERFAEFTAFCNEHHNFEGDSRRARVMGYGENGVRIAPGAVVRVPKEQIGEDVYIGLYAYLNGDITIGDHTMIGPGCSIAAGNHKFDPKTGWFSARTNRDGDDSIRIGFGCWLASNVTVTGGVKMGRANLICAGAVVTKSTPDYAIMAGVPAKQIGEINPETGEYIWYSKSKK